VSTPIKSIQLSVERPDWSATVSVASHSKRGRLRSSQDRAASSDSRS